MIPTNSDIKGIIDLNDVSDSVENQETVAGSSPNKIREINDTLIQYKESAFLSDMLSSSKD